MFDTLSSRLSLTIKKLRGQARLTPENMKETLREVRRALLEADVGLSVIQEFLSDIEKVYIGENVSQSLSPGQQLVKIVHQQLIKLIGQEQSPINLATTPPAVILLVGLQGVGKTTCAAKIAKKLSSQKKKALLCSCDVYRPAAIEQLRILAGQCSVDFFDHPSQVPTEIVQEAKLFAKKHLYDVLIIDSAGRTNIDETMMSEIKQIHTLTQPIETLLVSDSQQGQDAVNIAIDFNQRLSLTGLVFTKVDGDARGGAILSVRKLTQCPIKLLSTGEKLDDLQDFHPDRIASRILGMGDVLGLIEDLENKTDQTDQAKLKLAKKIQSGKAFDFNDLLTQLEQIEKMGGASSILEKLPGVGNWQNQLSSSTNPMDEKSIKHQKAIIFSMTPKERSDPSIIRGSHRRRIASGSGRTIQEINQLIKRLKEMKGMMKKIKNKNFSRQMGAMFNRPGSR